MSRYRKSWTQILHEVYCACKDCKCDPCECSKPGVDFPDGHEPQGIDDQYMQESAGLQLKMAFDDAGIKIKGVKNGKLVIAKKDMKKVEKIIAKQMKKPSDAKRILGSQIIFEDKASVLHKALGNDELKVPSGEEEEESYEYDGKVVKISKKDFAKVHKDFKNSTKGKERMLINDPKTGGSISVPVKFEEVELDEAGDKKWHWYNFDRGVYKLEKNSKGMVVGKMQDKKKEVRDGFPNAVEVLSNVKQAAKLVAKKNGFPLRGEEVELAEKGTAYPATVDTLKKIVKDKQNQTVMFDKGSAIVDLFSASAMVQVYDALKPATKKKFEDMIKSKEGFMKSQAFAMKMAK